MNEMSVQNMQLDDNTVYLIDGSGYIFRAYYAMPKLSSPSGLPTNAIYGFTTMILKLLREHNPKYLGIAFDTKAPTFRNEIYKDYKAHRGPAPDDLIPQLSHIHRIVDSFNIKKLVVDGYEADDLIGTAARIVREAGKRVVIVTADKDFMQLVDDNELVLLDELRAIKNGGVESLVDEKAVKEKFGVLPSRVIDVLALAGDAVDNVPGVRGIGLKTAADLINEYGALEQVLNSAPLIKQKARREKLLQDSELARLSKKLVTIDCHATYPMQLEDFSYAGVDRVQAAELFDEFGFKRLLSDPIVNANQKTSHPRAGGDPGEAATQSNIANLLDSRLRGNDSNTESHRVESIEQLEVFVARLKHEQTFSLNLVTASHPLQLTIGLVDGSLYDVDFSLPHSKDLIDTILRDSSKVIVVHDAKFVENVLVNHGFTPFTIKSDPMLASYVLRADTVKHDRNALHIEFQTNGNDVELANILESKLKDEQLIDVYRNVELPLTEVLAAMERKGIKIDAAALAAMSEEFTHKLSDLEKQAHMLAGGAFNLASPKQLADVLFNKLALKSVKSTKTGQSTDQGVLEELAKHHELPALLLEHRTVAKLKNTYVDVLPTLVNALTHRVHTTFNQAVTATGRLSSRDPNLQNIPIRGDDGKRIRYAFVAEEGKVLISLDYSQVELRILAHMSQDPVMLDAFRNDEDIHTRTASEVFSIPLENVTEQQRRVSKAINFGLVYGMGAHRLSQTLGISRQEASMYIDLYYGRYKGVYAWQKHLLDDAKAKQEVRTMFGRRRKLPEIIARNQMLVKRAERMAVNTPIQGTAADIIKIAMVNVHKALEEQFQHAHLLLQVHDELVIECNESDAAQVQHVAQKLMMEAVTLDVPLKVDVGMGHNWAVAHV